MTHIEMSLLTYGLSGIVFFLALGIVGLPIPDETIIVLAGMYVFKGKLPLIPTLLAIYAGGLIGITVSYLIGQTGGHFLINKYGHWLGLSPQKIAKGKKWFKDTGKWMLFFGYFVIGLRHLSGFVAGMMKLNYTQFALFAYTGLFIWATSIFAIGYYFSDAWSHQMYKVTWLGIGLALTALVAIYGFFFYKTRKKD